MRCQVRACHLPRLGIHTRTQGPWVLKLFQKARIKRGRPYTSLIMLWKLWWFYSFSWPIKATKPTVFSSGYLKLNQNFNVPMICTIPLSVHILYLCHWNLLRNSNVYLRLSQTEKCHIEKALEDQYFQPSYLPPLLLLSRCAPKAPWESM